MGSLAAALLIALTVAGFEPLESALVNWDEISIGLAELLLDLAWPCLVVFVGLALPSLALLRFVRHRWVAFLVAIALGLWLQGNLLVWDYGTLDGSPIDWGAHSAAGLLEIVIWGGLLLFALSRAELLARHALQFVGVLFAMQIGALAATYVERGPFADHLAESGKGDLSGARNHAVASFSRESNVVIIVLDMFQSDFFSEAMWDPGLANSMPPGFTYYRNAVSLYTSTTGSLQSILTSRSVPANVNLYSWQARQMKRSLPALLVERGFEAVLLTFSPQHVSCNFVSYGYRCVRSARDFIAGEPGQEVARRQDSQEILDVAFFRLAPHFLKPSIYDQGEWDSPLRVGSARPALDVDSRVFKKTQRDLSLLDWLIERAVAESLRPTFKLLHLFGVHYPQTVGATCHFAPREGGLNPEAARRRSVGTSICFLSRVYALLDRLDELGVYDDSLIFIVGDHGDFQTPLDDSVASPPIAGVPVASASGDRSSAPSPLTDIGRGVPLFLVKRAGARHALRTSDAPISLCDIPATIFEELRLDGGFDCQSVFAAASGRLRQRRHFRYDSAFPRGSPVRRLIEYRVQGHSWKAESWLPISRSGGEK